MVAKINNYSETAKHFMYFLTSADGQETNQPKKCEYYMADCD